MMVAIKSKALLDNLKPNMSVLVTISEEIQCNGFYVFVLNDVKDEFLVAGRMFAPAIGINEDPVTGNANGPLGAYLAYYKMVAYQGEVLKFRALQGEAMKRPGTIEVTVEMLHGLPNQVKITGEAVVVFVTYIAL